MGALTTCERCNSSFFPSDCKVEQVKDGYLTVSFFRCPYCKKPYLILTTNPDMRALIDKRKMISEKLKAARAKKFRESTFEKYIRENEKIKKQQVSMLEELQQRGEEVLARDPHA